jgi:hypothetical protein
MQTVHPLLTIAQPIHAHHAMHASSRSQTARPEPCPIPTNIPCSIVSPPPRSRLPMSLADFNPHPQFWVLLGGESVIGCHGLTSTRKGACSTPAMVALDLSTTDYTSSLLGLPFRAPCSLRGRLACARRLSDYKVLAPPCQSEWPLPSGHFLLQGWRLLILHFAGGGLGGLRMLRASDKGMI